MLFVTSVSAYASLQNGNSSTGFLLSLHAISLCNPDIPPTNKNLGIQLGDIAISMVKRSPDISSAAKAYSAHGCLRAFVDPLHMQIQYHEMSFRYAIASHTGDFVAVALGHAGVWRFFSGQRLPEIRAQFDEHGPKACHYQGRKPCRYHRGDNELYVLPIHQFLLNLEHGTHKPWAFEGPVFSELQYFEVIAEEKYKFQAHCYWLWKLWLANIFDAPIEVRLDYMERCYALQFHSSGFPQMPYSCYHIALVLIDANSRHELLESCVSTLRGYSNSAPMNYMGMELHLQAEMETDVMKTLALYNMAIEHAEAAQHLHLSPIMNERCARYTADHFSAKQASGYYTAAGQQYRQWGCIKGDGFAEFLGTEGLITELPLDHAPSATSFPISERLQFSALVQASLDIANEPDLKELAKKIINHIVDIVGADYCALISGRISPEILEVLATHDRAHGRTLVLEEDDKGADRVPWTIINYVARSRACVVNCMDVLGRATNDTFLAKRQPRSIFAIPMITQDRLVAIIYLHSQYPEAFDREKEAVVRLLSGQA